MSAPTPSARRRPRPSLRGLTLALTLLLASAAAPAADPKAARLYEAALERYEKQDFSGAIVQLRQALTIDRKLLPVQVLLGRALLAKAELAKAEAAFEEALRLGVNRAEIVQPLAEAVLGQARPQELLQQPRFADAELPPAPRFALLVLKASAALDTGSTKDGLRLLQDARAIDPGRIESWLAEVPLRLRAQQPREAQAAAERALTLQPQSADALYLRGTVDHASGALAGALSFYEKCLALRPEHVEALVARTGLLLDLKRPVEAARDLALLRKAAPADPRGAFLVALQAESNGDTQEARAALGEVTKLLDAVPIEFLRYHAQWLVLGGLAHYGLARPDKARPYLEFAQRQHPGSAASKLLAQVYLGEKNANRAVESLDAYLRGHPDDTQALRVLAAVHMAEGRNARAATLIESALKKRDDPLMRGLLGQSLIGSGRLETAAAELEAALKRDPGQVPAGLALAQIYLAAGQPERAVPLLGTLIQKQSGNASLHQLLGTAKALRGDLNGARLAFEQATRLAPDYQPAQVSLARLEGMTRKFDAAEARLTGVLAKDNKAIDALLELARVAVLRGKPDTALALLQRAEGHAGQNLVPGLQLVDFHLRQQRPDRARDAMKGLVNKAPEALPVLLAQARVQLAAGELVPARTTLTRATTLANFDTPMLVQVALLQIQGGHWQSAAFALDKALQARPDDLNAQALLVEVELRQGEPAKAEAHARALMAKHPKLGLGPALLGDIAMARGQRSAAIDAYRRAHELDRDGDSLLRLLETTAGQNPEAALQLADGWLKANPNDVTVRRGVATALARQGQLARAKSAFEALLKVVPDDFDALNNLANLLILLKDGGSLKVAERALALRPDLPHVIGTTGWAAFQSGQTERALQLLREARLRDPANPDTRYFLGAVLASRGRGAEARDELQGALHGQRLTAYTKEAQDLLRTLQ